VIHEGHQGHKEGVLKATIAAEAHKFSFVIFVYFVDSEYVTDVLAVYFRTFTWRER
jgi:hypothetical protein